MKTTDNRNRGNNNKHREADREIRERETLNERTMEENGEIFNPSGANRADRPYMKGESDKKQAWSENEEDNDLKFSNEVRRGYEPDWGDPNQKTQDIEGSSAREDTGVVGDGSNRTYPSDQIGYGEKNKEHNEYSRSPKKRSEKNESNPENRDINKLKNERMEREKGDRDKEW